MELWKIGGRQMLVNDDGDREKGPVTEQLVLFQGDRANRQNIERQIERFKDRNGIATPRELAKWVNSNSPYLTAQVFSKVTVNHALEHTDSDNLEKSGDSGD